MEYYSAIKENTFESVLMRWMKLEPIIQSEASRKKNTNTVYQCIYMEFRKMVMISLELYKKDLHNLDNHHGVITHLESDILECDVKWALESITMNKASGVMEFQLSYFKS